MRRPVFVSLRTKLLIGTILIVAALMAAVTAVVEHRQRTTIIEEVHRHGTAMAEGLAGVSAGALLLYNFTALEQNVAQLDLVGRVSVVRLAVDRFLAGRPPAPAPFDLVLADPPYDTSDDAVGAMVRALAGPGWLAPGAVVAVERPARAGIAAPEGFRACWERTFGDTLVFFVDAVEPPS